MIILHVYTITTQNEIFWELIWNFNILFEKIILTHDHGLL
jgi:hypothetical protein